MGKRASARTARSITLVGIVAALVVFIPTIAASASGHSAKSEHWGVITRNTIGSPVADLRSGPYGSFGVTGAAAAPPYGKGSLGMAVAAIPGYEEKVDYGNEVDFFGDHVVGINQVGFHVFQAAENATPSPRNMPNIKMEIDPNLVCSASNYTTMVWVPGPAPVTNRWSGYIDATTNGNWYFTSAAIQACTGCTAALNCNWTQAKAALGADDAVDGSPATIYTLLIGKGRDGTYWVGAVDGLRINSKIYDFEAKGVKERDAGHR